MQIEETFPPNYDLIKEKFDVEGKPVVFTFNNTLHNPNGGEISDDLLEHESTHYQQQLQFIGGAEVWWKKYIEDPVFRLSQEVEAYHCQYKYLKSKIRDRNFLAKHQWKLANDLSSSIYGKLISHSEALRYVRLGK